jgi:hypothetical protein
VPIILTANSRDKVKTKLIKPYFEKKVEEEDFVVHFADILVGHQVIELGFERIKAEAE